MCGAQAQANTLNRLIIDNARGGSYRTPFMTGADNMSELSQRIQFVTVS